MRVRRKSTQLPPLSYLQECFDYDPASGFLRWKRRPLTHFSTLRACSITNSKFAGKIAGNEAFQKDGTPSGISVTVAGFNARAHLIIARLMNLTVPEGFQVDHRNGNPFYNAWNNLRVATPIQNAGNSCNRRRKRSKLPKGVTALPNGKFRARIVNGPRIHLGCFESAEEAHTAYCRKAKEVFGEFARFN